MLAFAVIIFIGLAPGFYVVVGWWKGGLETSDNFNVVSSDNKGSDKKFRPKVPTIQIPTENSDNLNSDWKFRQ
jgi:hypothetical protein